MEIGDTVTITRVGGPGSHGFALGQEVTLKEFDDDGDMVFTDGDAIWFLKPEDWGSRVVEVNAAQQRYLIEAAQAAENASRRDSNDDEIEKLREAYEAAYGALGIEIPEGADPCDFCEGSKGEHETDVCPGVDDD